MPEREKIIERERKKIEERIKFLRENKDRFIANVLDRMRRNLEAIYDARLDYLIWRLNNVESRGEANLYQFRVRYYLRMGYPLEAAEGMARRDVERYREGIRKVFGLE